jgi:hypothetical protein
MRMSTRIAAAIGLAAVATLGSPATAGDTDKATGGGQILLSSDGRGPGDTIAFTAQAREDGTVVGNVNIIDRAGTGPGTGAGRGFHFKGDVICIDVQGNVAKIGGYGENADGETTGFTLVVTDNGEGLDDNDLIALEYVDEPTCEHEDGDNDGAVELARGNAQVKDGI